MHLVFKSSNVFMLQQCIVKLIVQCMVYCACQRDSENGSSTNSVPVSIASSANAAESIEVCYSTVGKTELVR